MSQFLDWVRKKLKFHNCLSIPFHSIPPSFLRHLKRNHAFVVEKHKTKRKRINSATKKQVLKRSAITNMIKTLKYESEGSCKVMAEYRLKSGIQDNEATYLLNKLNKNFRTKKVDQLFSPWIAPPWSDNRLQIS